ncbi:MAG: DUF4956 domain-containing protein [Candidatus Aminicenantes bacterium]|nr:DUF4956 domain-containing protein [Candidatus Aminicenantes bacterium]
MPKVDLFDYIQKSNAVLTAGLVIINMFVTFLIASFIYWVYKKTYTGVMYSKNFNVTLVLTSMVTAMVMMVIGTNLALSLGMVGALSIVRFRSAIKDPRDIGFLFWGIGAGLSAGTGSYLIALIGSIIIAIILFVFQKGTTEVFPYLLVIKGSDIDENNLGEIMKKSVQKSNLRMKNMDKLGSEIVFEIRFKHGQDDILLKNISEMDEVSSVNIISYKGEVAG